MVEPGGRPSRAAPSQGPAAAAGSWERAMLERIAAGDDSALAKVYDQYSPFVYALAARVLHDRVAAEDVVQEVFLHVWRRASDFDEHRGTLRAWLGVITHRRAVDRVRRVAAARAREEREALLRTSAPPDIEEAATSLLLAERVRAALASLPHEQRSTIELAYFSGRTFREVAVELGIPEGTAKSRIRLGLAKLAEALQGATAWT